MCETATVEADVQDYQRALVCVQLARLPNSQTTVLPLRERGQSQENSLPGIKAEVECADKKIPGAFVVHGRNIARCKWN